MKKKFSFFVTIAVNLLCTYFLVSGSTDDVYTGIGFPFVMYEAIFCTLAFVVLSLLLRNSGNSVFSCSNISRLLRVGSRRKAALFELFKILIIVFSVEFLNSICVYAVSAYQDKKIILSKLMILFLINLLVKTSLLFSQTVLEINHLYKFGFVFICGMFIFLLMLGSSLHTITSENPTLLIRPFLNILNKINIVNYISIKRANTLCSNLCVAISLIGLTVLIKSVLFIFVSKKTDVLARE